MNYLAIAIILFGGFQLSNGDSINCLFQYKDFWGWGEVHTCTVSSFENSGDNKVISGYNGGKLRVNDVLGIWIHDTNAQYIPANLGSVFNLIAFAMTHTRLVAIRARDFDNMPDLKCLNLKDNQLSHIPTDTFFKLPQLERISFLNNYVVELPNDLFRYNRKLNFIHFENNKVKYIGSTLFLNLSLRFIISKKNDCINESYSGHNLDGYLNQIKANCKNPNEDKNGLQFWMDQRLAVEKVETMRKNEISRKENELKAKIQEEGEEKIRIQKALELEVKLKIEREEKIRLQKAVELKAKIQQSLDEQNRKQKAVELEAKIQKEREEKFRIQQNLMEAEEEKKNSCERNLIEANGKLLNYYKSMKELTVKLVNLKKLNTLNANCVYADTNEGYLCEIRDLSIDNRNKDLNEVLGSHLKSKSKADVTEVVVARSSMSYLSKKIIETFPNLQNLRIHASKLKDLSKGDFNSAKELKHLNVQGNEVKSLDNNVFEGAKQLEILTLDSNQIEKISINSFNGLAKLKNLSLKDNLITDLDLGTFKELSKLQTLILSSNKIKFLDGKLFQFNKNLEMLLIDQNKLREIGENILNYAVNIKHVNFNGNPCIIKTIFEQQLYELNFLIKHCCKNPNETLDLYNCGHKGWEDYTM